LNLLRVTASSRYRLQRCTGGERIEHRLHICDDSEWYVEFSWTSATLGNAEADRDLGSLRLAGRSDAIAIAAEFLAGTSRPFAPARGGDDPGRDQQRWAVSRAACSSAVVIANP